MANVHTVMLDRAGYVVQTWLNTSKACMDERAWPGRLIEVEGDVCPGWRWDGERFILPPQRPHPAAVVEEATRRIETYFPERFRAQVTALGGTNAITMHRYCAEVQKTLEQMLAAEAPPSDFKENHHWPTPPLMVDLAVPHRAIEHHPVQAQPITVHVAPVIHTGERGQLAQVPSQLGQVSGVDRQLPVPTLQQRAQATDVVAEPVQTQSRPRVAVDNTRPPSVEIDQTDPLYALKVALVRSIAAIVEAHKATLPPEIVNQWQNELAEIAALGTAATSLEAFQKQQQRVEDFISGKAA